MSALNCIRPDQKCLDWVNFSSTLHRTVTGLLWVFLDLSPHVLSWWYLTKAIQSDVIITSKEKCLCCASYAWCPRVQKTCDKSCTKLEKVWTRSYKMIITAIQEEAMRCTQVFEWFCHFKNGHISIESECFWTCSCTPLISETPLRPFSLMWSLHVNSSACVMLCIHEEPK